MRLRFFDVVGAAVGLLTVAGLVSAFAPPPSEPGSEDIQDLSKVKQMAVGLLIYMADADDVAPLAFAVNQGHHSVVGEFPLGWRNDSPPTHNQSDTAHWSSAIYPYLKSQEVYFSKQGEEKDLGGVPRPGGVAPSYTTFTFNGLLHSYNMVKVVNPAATTLIGATSGMVKWRGYALTNPYLECGAGQTCRYQMAVANCQNSSSGGKSRVTAEDVAFFTASGKNPVAYADGHAKHLRRAPASNAKRAPAPLRPWAEFDDKGRPTSAWYDKFGCHPLAFRPDYDPTADDVSAITKAR